MALFGPERIPFMNIVRLRIHVLTPGVIGALLVSLVLSFAFAGTAAAAAAAPRTCVFTATSSTDLRAITANRWGSLDIVDVTVTKYTNGCGSEYGVMTGNSENDYTSIAVTVSVGSAQNSASYMPYAPNVLVTPTILGNSPACGTVAFQAPPDPPAYASRCTPS
jgi:hypothetical protein